MALYLSGESTNGSVNIGLNSDKNSAILAESVIYNCSAHVEEKDGQKVAKGNVTEVGLLKYLMESNISIDELYINKGSETFFEFQIPFNSSRKRQTSAVRLANGNVRVFVKGGPEIVIEQCTSSLNAEGKKTPLSDDQKNELMNVSIVKQYASKCYRTLLVAYCDYSDSEW